MGSKSNAPLCTPSARDSTEYGLVPSYRLTPRNVYVEDDLDRDLRSTSKMFERRIGRVDPLTRRQVDSMPRSFGSRGESTTMVR
ncbi:hypothetical protein CRG98_011637 [Punica granatum]|uniref:Uncharacterized protein n=1 Tax=Punica granatum TaxID=22663 RepID=A0A2I0KHW0_PUNGR|nr:hypothetical protein CRG98_011637 [Punica granatum]